MWDRHHDSSKSEGEREKEMGYRSYASASFLPNSHNIFFTFFLLFFLLLLSHRLSRQTLGPQTGAAHPVTAQTVALGKKVPLAMPDRALVMLL